MFIKVCKSIIYYYYYYYYYHYYYHYYHYYYYYYYHYYINSRFCLLCEKLETVAVCFWLCFTDLSDSLPVASHHGLVGHEFQQGAALTEFINCFL